MIKQNKYYTEGVNKIIKQKYDTKDNERLMMDFNCHIDELRKDIYVDIPVLVVNNSMG